MWHKPIVQYVKIKIHVVSDRRIICYDRGRNILYHIGICDDEKGTCARLEDVLREYEKKKGICLDISVWYSGEYLCDFLRQGERPDLLFLDIELVSTDGIQVGRYIREELQDIDIMLVYISSKSSYAMNLFRVQPLDFLIKPIASEMMEELMERWLHICERKNQIFEYSIKGCHFRVPYHNILYFYSQNKKITLVLRDEEIPFYGKLKEIAAVVPHNFIMIHQSYLINLDYVAECSYEMIKMMNGSLLNISQPYRKRVREEIMRNKWEKIK